MNGITQEGRESLNSLESNHQQHAADQIKLIEGLLVDSPEDPWLHLELSRLHLVTEQMDYAEKIVQEVLVQPDSERNLGVKAACLDRLGHIALFKGDAQEATRCLALARKLREEMSEPELLAQTYYNLATAHWMLGELDHVIEIMELCVSTMPEWSLAYDALAKAYGEAKMHQKQTQAMAKLASLLANAPNQEPDSAPEQQAARNHFRRGVDLELQGDYQRAVDEFERAVALGITNADIYHRLGMCLSEVGLYREAVQALKTSLELDPEFPIPHYDLGIVYQRLGMTQVQIHEYQQAIELDPDFLLAYLALIEAYLEAGQPELALVWTERTKEIGGADDRLLFLEGKAHRAKGELLECYQAWCRALELVRDENLRGTYLTELDELEKKISPSTFEQRAAALNILMEAQRLKQDKQFDAAIACLEESCAADPHFFEVHRELAFAYLNTGRLEEAKALFDKLVREYPGDQEVHLGLGMVLAQTNHHSEARQALSKAHELAAHTRAGRDARAHLTKLDVQARFGSLPVLRFDEALEHAEAGRLEQAITDMQSAVALAPEIGLFYGELGWLYFFADRRDDAIRQFKKAIEIEPKEAIHLSGLGFALLKQGNGYEAMPIVQRAVALAPSEASFHNTLAACYLAVGNRVVAEVEFRKAIELSPEEDAWINLCRFLISEGKHEQAIDELQELIQFFPDSHIVDEARSLLDALHEGKQRALEHQQAERSEVEDVVKQLREEGKLLDAYGYSESAIERYQAAIAEEFDTFDAHFALGNIYARLQRHERAIAEYSLSVRMKAPKSEIADAYYNMGNSYRDLDEPSHAISAYERAIETYPQIRDARGNIAACLAAQEQYTQAIEMMQEEVRSHPDKEHLNSVHFSMGLWLFQAGKELEAFIELQKAKLLGAKVGTLHELTGSILVSRGYWNLAESEYEAALEIAPDRAWVRTAVRACRFFEYELPRLLTDDDPRVKHSLEWRREQIQQDRSDVMEKIEIVDLGQGEYAERRVNLG